MTSNSFVTKGWHWFILILIVIGLFVQFFTSPLSIMIPLLIIGILYYLYKRPPRWLQRFAYHQSRRIIPPQQPIKKKKIRYPFRVIDGKKKNYQ